VHRSTFSLFALTGAIVLAPQVLVLLLVVLLLWFAWR
jgi:hypothetical protein